MLYMRRFAQFVPIAQFKKREKRQWKSTTFSKVATKKVALVM